MRPNLNKPEGKSPGGPSNFKKEIILIATEDILKYPDRDENNIRMIGDYVLKANAKMHTFYHTAAKADGSWESTGEPDAFSREPKFVAQHPGDEIEALEFFEKWTGVDCVILIGNCGRPGYKVEGTSCVPMQLVPSFTGNNDGTFFTVTFQGDGKTSQFPGYYEGNLTFADPVKVASNTVTVDGEVGKIVQLPSADTTAEISFTALNNLKHNDRVTLIGGGGDDPYTLANGGTGTVVTLKNGTSWTSLENATITLRYFDAGATKYLIEENRK